MSKSKKVKVGNLKVNKDTKDILEKAMGKDKFELLGRLFESTVKEIRENSEEKIK